MKLKERILKEMLVDESPKGKIKAEIRKEILYHYPSEIAFDIEFERAYNKCRKDKLNDNNCKEVAKRSEKQNELYNDRNFNSNRVIFVNWN